MRMLISGGGIAGITLAYWLRRYGFEPVVIEQASTIRHEGYAIDFFGTGYDVAGRMDLIDRLQARQVPIEYVAYVNGSGTSIARLDISLVRKIMHGKYMALMHWTLEEPLYEALAANVAVRFGRSLVAVRNSPQAVMVSYDVHCLTKI